MLKYWTSDIHAIIASQEHHLKVQGETLEALYAEIANFMQPCVQLLNVSPWYLAEPAPKATTAPAVNCHTALDFEDLSIPEAPYTSSGLKVPVTYKLIT